MRTHRFRAEWICNYPDDDGGDFDPYLYEYDFKSFTNYRDANAHARRMALFHHVAGDWWRVTEQRYDPNYYERGVGDWYDVATWVCGMRIDK